MGELFSKYMYDVEISNTEHQKLVSDTHLAVAAIDFGTTFSGYAFSFRSDYERDKTKVTTNTWIGRGTLLSHKAPTSVLFDAQKSFIAFGYDAEDQYSDLAFEGVHREYFYFRHFKMQLYNKVIDKSLQIQDETGKTMLAMDVFTASIEYLKNSLLKHCRTQIDFIEETDFQWVLTVPAIWTEQAKKFMRTVSEKAGLSQLYLCLEPEAASILCRCTPMKREGQFVNPFMSKSRYMIIDAGGGTVDITVHEVTDAGTIKELTKASGGGWGGTAVDKNFIDLLEKICGQGSIAKLKGENMDDFLELMASFEVKKRRKTLNNISQIRLPEGMLSGDEVLQRIEEMNPGVTTRADKLCIARSVMESLFYTPCKSTVDHVRNVLQQIDPIDAILMVGGFSESVILQDAVKNAFPEKQVIIPPEAGLAVLKGAVIFGHDPMVISERRCRYTYGVRTMTDFDKSVHPQSQRIGGVFCKDTFTKHVSSGEKVQNGKAQAKKVYQPLFKRQKQLKIEFFASKEKDPKFVTDVSCIKLGSILVDISGVLGDCRVEVAMRFGGTEIEAEAIIIDTGKKLKARLELLD